MTSPRLVLLLALQIGSVVSFSRSPLGPRHNALKPSTAVVGIELEVPRTEPRFEQNSRLMYDDILEAMPWFIRKMVQKNMNNAIAELCEEAVTENDMYAVIAKITPKSNLQDSLDVLDKLKTRAPENEEAALDAAADAFFTLEKEANIRSKQSAKPVIHAILDSTLKTTEKNAINVISDMCEDAVIRHDVYKCLEEEHDPTTFFTIAEKEICFQQNSKMMYDRILEGHPKFILRQVVENNLGKAISVMCPGAVMTENDMYEVINAVSPKPLLKFNLSILDEHKSSSEQ